MTSNYTNYRQKYLKYLYKYQRAGAKVGNGLYGESYALKNITQLSPLSLNELSVNLSLKLGNPPTTLLVIVGAPYYHLQHLAHQNLGIVPDGESLTHRRIQPLLKLKEHLALTQTPIDQSINRLLLDIPNVPIVAFRQIVTPEGHHLKPGWVCGVPDPVKYVVDCGSGKLSVHHRVDGREIKAYRVEGMDRITTQAELLEKLQQVLDHLGPELTDAVFYFSGRWRTNPLYQQAYQDFQAPGLTKKIISQADERQFAFQRVQEILRACQITHHYVVMLDSGGGSTQIAEGLV